MNDRDFQAALRRDARIDAIERLISSAREHGYNVADASKNATVEAWRYSTNRDVQVEFLNGWAEAMRDDAELAARLGR